jgi:hypothetical protein
MMPLGLLMLLGELYILGRVIRPVGSGHGVRGA